METDKSLLSEEDIKHRYITPALERVWDPSDIRMELPITAGRVNIRGNLEVRDRRSLPTMYSTRSRAIRWRSSRRKTTSTLSLTACSRPRRMPR